MPFRRDLTPEEERQCLGFLHSLGIHNPEHRVFSDRGYFGLFLNGLRPEDVGETAHPSVREFRDTVRLMATAGVDRLKGILERERSKQPKGPAADPPTGPMILDIHLEERKRQAPKAGARSAYSTAREIRAEPPGEQTRERMRSLDHAGTPWEAVSMAQEYAAAGQLHEGYHILVDHLMTHGLSEEPLRAATDIILEASRFDRDKAIPPVNMLYECEEMAAVLARKIPDMRELAETGDEKTRHLYRYVKIVYKTWVMHAHAMLEYKYRANNTQWVRRTWVEPRDFGFLVEVMRMAVRSRLPLDLLRFVYMELKTCINIGLQVIAYEDKQARFEGDVLRIIASPTKDIIPDLTFEMFREIVLAYLRAGDSQNAMIFCKQALLIRRSDREILQIKQMLTEHGSRSSQELARRSSTMMRTDAFRTKGPG